MKTINYKIRFGEKVFSVNEWLYNYFNEVKEKPHLYKQLFNVLTGVKKKLLTILLILTAGYLHAQTQPTLASLDADIKALKSITVDTASNNKPIYTAITTIKTDAQNWMNAVRKNIDDTINVRVARAVKDCKLIDSINSKQNQVDFGLIRTDVLNLQNKPDNTASLQSQIDAIKLRIDNLIKTLTTIQ